MPGGKNALRPEDNPKPFKKGVKTHPNQGKRGKGKKTLIKGLLDTVHEEVAEYRFKNVTELYKSGPKKGKPTGRKVDVSIPLLNDRALNLIGLEFAKKHRDFYKWLVEMESGKPVESIKMRNLDEDEDGVGFTVELK